MKCNKCDGSGEVVPTYRVTGFDDKGEARYVRTGETWTDIVNWFVLHKEAASKSIVITWEN